MQLWLNFYSFIYFIYTTCHQPQLELKMKLLPSGLFDRYRLKILLTPVEPTASSTLLCLLSLSRDIVPPLQQHPPCLVPRHPCSLPHHSLISLEFLPETSWLSPPSFFLHNLLLSLQASCCLLTHCVAQLLLLSCSPVQSMDVKGITTCTQLPSTINETLNPLPRTGNALRQPLLLHKHFPSILTLTLSP